MIAFIPHLISAWGACSLLEPHPKLLLTISIVAFLFSCKSKGCLPFKVFLSSSKTDSPNESKLTHFKKRAGIIRSVSMSLPINGIHSPLIFEIFPIGCVNSDFHHLINSLTSLTLPLIAAAATIAGLMSSVLPLGDPCRPLKFLLLELALT